MLYKGKPVKPRSINHNLSSFLDDIIQEDEVLELEEEKIIKRVGEGYRVEVDG